MDYTETADELTTRIVALGPAILAIESPWDLFKTGLKCDDISPSLAQADFAMRKAQAILRRAAEPSKRGD
jgi:hypothetical protein